MKKIFCLSFIIPTLLFGQAFEADKGIHFEHSSFAELLEKAKKENKMIMVDAYTTWCGPCKWMSKNIFTNDTVAEYYNAKFINAKIDMEKGEGIEIRKKYEVMCYPTFLFIDESGVLRHRQSGSMVAKEFVELGTTAKNPSKQFAVFKSKYDSGNITSDEMGEYVLMRGLTCLSAKEEMAKYFSTQADADLIKQRNWDILVANYNKINVDAREFKYLVDHREEYEKKYNPQMAKEGQTVIGIIKLCYSAALNNFLKNKNTEGYKRLKEEVLQKNFPFSEEVIGESDMIMYKSNNDWAAYAQTAIKYIDRFKKEDYNALNSMAWNFYENVDDKIMLAKAEQWIKHSVELHPEYANYDTYAAVLYKSGKKAEAKTTAEKAIEIAKKEGEDYKETQVLLDKINLMK